MATKRKTKKSVLESPVEAATSPVAPHGIHSVLSALTSRIDELEKVVEKFRPILEKLSEE